MNRRNSKSLIILLLIATVLYACNPDKKTTKKKTIINDTITTTSGLKYYYISKGTGRKVEPGSKISAMLSLQVKDSVVWTSYASKDSIFSHIAGRGGVISGYDEMALLMRRGDNVVAILPSNLAYGEKGSGKAIPPNSTLIYNQFKITYVSEPKLVLSDSLFVALEKGGIKKMKPLYKKITSTKDSLDYHRGLDQLNSLWRKLSRQQMFVEAKEAFTLFNKQYKNVTFDFYIIRSLESMGKNKQAIDHIDKVLKQKEITPAQKEYFIKYKLEISSKLPKR